MALSTITPTVAADLCAKGATLIDIRGRDEFARERVGHADNLPLDSLHRIDTGGPIIFMCKSGMRTSGNAERLARSACGEAYILSGGLDGWKGAGMPTVEDKSGPIEIMRQVQIAAGSLVLIGVSLGWFAHPVWFGLSAFAGATGWCGMAHLLALMPWNRRAAA